MSIKFSVDGIEFTADTAAEAAAMLRELRMHRGVSSTLAGRRGRAGAAPRGDHAPGELKAEFPAWAHGAALKFLTTIRDGGSKGIGSTLVMKALDTTKPKAIGGRSAIINRLLQELGFSPSQVYDNSRTPIGRVWAPKKQIGVAIDKLQQDLAA
jgi:hypothetical protein